MAADTLQEAESMEYGVVDRDGTTWPRAELDAAASGGKLLHYGPNGTAGKTFTLDAPMTSLTLRARGAQCSGAPIATVTVDGTTVGNVSVGATSWTSYKLAVSVPAGPRRVAVRFDNNYYSSGATSCNRDLYLDRVDVSTTLSTTIASGAATLTTATGAATSSTPSPAGITPGSLWLSPTEIARLPMSGPGWTYVKSVADGSLGTPNIADQNNFHGVRVLGTALAYARTGNAGYREKARAAIMSAIGTEAGTRTLALARNIGSYVLAADLINLRELNPGNDATFRSWISGLRTRVNDANARWTTLVVTSDNSANNWGTFATASRIAIDLYLGDTADLQRAAQIHLAYADRSRYPAGKSWGNYFQPTAGFDPVHWACGDSSTWLAINPPCTKSGYNIDGAFVEDMSREEANATVLPQPSGSLGVSYSWEALQGVMVQAELLRRAGYPSLWDTGSSALLRATRFIQRAGWQETWTVTRHVPWLINARYGTAFPVRSSVYGRLVGFTDWTHGS